MALPATEKSPPSVNNPLPKVSGRLLTVFKFKVPVIKSIIGFVPVKFKLDISVVVFVTVRLLMVEVARVEEPVTLKLPEMTWLPVVVALPPTDKSPLTVSLATVEVAKLPVPETERLPKIIWLAVVVALPVTNKLPPAVKSPEPNVIGWLFKVLMLSVPVVASKIGEDPVKEMFVDASVVVEPLTSRLPPSVNKPVPVVTGELFVVLSERVPPDSLIVVPDARLMVLPCTVKLPPSVSNPEPVVMGWLLVVFMFSVPVVASNTGEAPVKLSMVDAMVVVAPLMVTLPPKVASPLPNVIGRLVTVLMPSVETEVKSIIGFVPVRFKLLDKVVVLVTVKLAIVVVARVDALLTFKVPLIT